MISDVPNGFEAHKLINISLGKIAASRTGRTGPSLHKSLLVASVLHKARFVYLEEAQHYHHPIFCPPQGQPDEFAPDPPRAPTPLPEVTVTPVMPLDCVDDNNIPHNEYSNDCISEECKSRLEESSDSDLESNCCDLESNSEYGSSESSRHTRKRRRVSDQETEAAVSSILPKRLKSELDSDQCTDCFYNDPPYKYETKIVCTCGFDLSSCHCTEQPPDDEICNMEVDHITSLVSIFSFNQQQQQQQQQQQSDLCSTQAHHKADSVRPPVLALTA